MPGRWTASVLAVSLAVLLLWARPWYALQTPAIPERVMTLSGTMLPLSGEGVQRGTLLVFWSLFCSPCLAEIPDIIRLDSMARQRGIRLMLVAMDTDPPAQVLAMQQAGAWEFPVTLDRITRISGLLDIAAIPASVLLDRAGRPVMRRVGALQVESVMTAMDMALAHPIQGD